MSLEGAVIRLIDVEIAQGAMAGDLACRHDYSLPLQPFPR
jgi:hypothetical protein